jgi:hypothetical protein
MSNRRTTERSKRGIAGALSALLALTFAGGCAPDLPLGPRDAAYDVVHTFPDLTIFEATSSPDGAIFFTTFAGELWRGDPAADTWTRLTEVPGLPEIYAPSRDLVFVAAGAHLYRWTSARGLVEDPSPISNATIGCADFFTAASVSGLGGRGPNDVYAVGDHGLIAHFDGTRWSLEPNPLRDAAPSLCWAAYETDLHSVAVGDAGVYASGIMTVVERGADRQWREVARPPGPETTGALWSVVAQRDRMWFAGGDFQRLGDAPPYEFREPARLFRRSAGAWHVERGAVEAMPGLNGGTAHDQGPAVFWGYTHQLAVARGDGVRAFTLPRLRLRGAVPSGDAVYLLGADATRTVVARLRE